MRSGRKAGRRPGGRQPEIHVRLRSIGDHRALKLAGSDTELASEALYSIGNADTDELEALPGKKNIKPGEPDALQLNTSNEADEQNSLPQNGNTDTTGRLALVYKKSAERSGGFALLDNEDTTIINPKLLSHKQPTNLYLLRGLLWCGLCDEAFGCALAATGVRYYGCMNKRCPRPLVRELKSARPT